MRPPYAKNRSSYRSTGSSASLLESGRHASTLLGGL